MKLAHFTLLSIGSILILTACNERGKAISPSAKKLFNKKQEEKVYDFPVLKLSANEESNLSAEEILSSTSTASATEESTKPSKAKKSVENSSSTSQALRFPKMSTETEESTAEKEEISSLIQSDSKEKPSKKALSKKPKTKTKTMTTEKEKLALQKEAMDKVLAETKKLQVADKAKVVRRKKQQNRQTSIKVSKRRTQKSASSQIPIISSILKPDVSLQDIPILNKILPKSSTKSKGRIKTHTKHASRPQSTRNTHIPTLDNTNTQNTHSTHSFSGGTSSNNLDMAKIRVETDNYQTNVILDSYLWSGYNSMPTEASAVSGTYFFKYEPYKHRIVGDIKGYNSFSALVKKQDSLLQDNPVVKNIYIDRYLGDDGIQFIIELKKEVKVNIIDVEDPGSIIIELYPKEKN